MTFHAYHLARGELEPKNLLSVGALAQALLYSRREHPRGLIASTPAVLHTKRHNTIITHKTCICEIADWVRWNNYFDYLVT